MSWKRRFSFALKNALAALLFFWFEKMSWGRCFSFDLEECIGNVAFHLIWKNVLETESLKLSIDQGCRMIILMG